MEDFGIGFFFGAIVIGLLAALFAWGGGASTEQQAAAAQFCKPRCPGEYTYRIGNPPAPWMTCICQEEAKP